MKGFFTGGGEIYPIIMANELLSRNFDVSVVLLSTTDENSNIARRLDPRITIYSADEIRHHGAQEFLDAIGSDVIHTHYVGADFLLLSEKTEPFRQPYFVSLHGSYEVTPLPGSLLLNMLRYVNHWYYLDEKNLAHFEGIPISKDRFEKVRNGVAPDNRPFPVTRTQLGFKPRDFLFAVVTRAIPEKGWSEAIKAFRLAQHLMPDRRLGLILCGDGPHLSAIREEVGDDASIKVLGYQDCIQGLYRLANCAVLPTRFKGESFPLTLIEAFLAGRPAIATDIGMISDMINAPTGICGVTVQYDENDEVFVNSLAEALVKMASTGIARNLGLTARRSASSYRLSDITQKVTNDYVNYFHGNEG
jgi:glycosyltransferase involved in cell wall biosynthesis